MTDKALVQTDFRDRLTALAVEMSHSDSQVDVDIACVLIVALGTYAELDQLSKLAAYLQAQSLAVSA